MDRIDKIEVIPSKSSYSLDDTIHLLVKFSVQGKNRESFTEQNWTEAYNANDVSVKMKYEVHITSTGLRRQKLGKPIISYKKAAIFWTRNPKLVNPMKEKRVWVQVAKNFTPIIKLTEEEVRQELFDFEEDYTIKASELGKGTHKVRGNVQVSWQKHHFLDKNDVHSDILPVDIQVD